MKAGWKIERLDDVCDLITCGVAARPKYVAVGVPFLSAKNVKDGNIIWSGYNCVSKKTHDELTKNNKPIKGDILYTRVGSFGEAAVIEEETEFSVFVSLTLIKPKKHLLNNYFLKYYLNSSEVKELAKRSINSSGVGNLNVGTVREFPIHFPTLPEQQRIVGILDEAFNGIATAKVNAEKNLQNARALFESHLQSVFTQRGEGWTEIKLADVCQSLHQGLNTAGEKVKFYKTGYPIIQTRNIDDGVVDLDNKIKLMCEEDWLRYKDKYRPGVGDVFFTNIGTIGKTAIVTVARDYLIHWNIFKLRPHREKITSAYLRYTLEQLTMSGYFKKLQKGGTVDFVTKKMISEALIYLPSILEQTNIVNKLDTLREEALNLESIYEQKIAALDELKKSLLNQAFTGEL